MVCTKSRYKQSFKVFAFKIEIHTYAMNSNYVVLSFLIRFLFIFLFTCGCEKRVLIEENINVSPQSEPNISVHVEVTPSDAIIEATNMDGEVVSWLAGKNEIPFGRWKVQVNKHGWVEQETVIDISNETRTLLFTLKAEIQNVTYASSPTSHNTLLMDENKMVNRWSGDATFELPTGRYKLTSTWEAYPTKERILTIDRDTEIFNCPQHSFNHVRCDRVIESRRAPKSVNFSPDGKQVWATLLVGPPAVKVFSVETGDLLASIDLGEKGGVELLFSEDGSLAWVSQMHTSSVFEIDTSTFEVLRQLPSKSSWTKVIAKSNDEQFLYVSNWVGDDVSEIELNSGVVTRKWKTNDTPRGLFYTRDDNLLVASFEEGTVQSIDIKTGLITTIFEGARSARHLEYDQDLGRLYISDLRGGKVWVVDMSTKTSSILAAVDKNPNTIRLSLDKRLLFVSCRGKNNRQNYINPGPEYGTVFIIDAYTGTILDVIVGGNQPTGLDVSPDGKLLAFSDFWDHKIKIFSVPSTQYLLENGGDESLLQYKDYLTK